MNYNEFISYCKVAININEDRPAYHNFKEWANKVGKVDRNNSNPADITVRFPTHKTIDEVKEDIMEVYKSSNDAPQDHDIYIYCYDEEDMHTHSLKESAHFSNGDWQFDCE